MLFYQLTQTKQFLAQLNALPADSRRLVLEKVSALSLDPRPDGAHKKKLAAHQDLYRLRAGNYRVFYSMIGDVVDVLGVGPRKDVYRKTDRLGKLEPTPVYLGLDAAEIDDLIDDDDDDASPAGSGPAVGFLPVDWYAAPEPATEPLPRPVDAALLRALRIPALHWESLSACDTVDALLMANVPGDVLERIVNAITAPDLDALSTAAKFRVDSAGDFLYGDTFDQINLLLQLDPDQMKYVNWAIFGRGPTLLKGGPGTGKSIIGVYRAAALIELLRKSGVAQPRILYTTYTRSLAESSRQLIGRLAAANASCIDVRHFDPLHLEILESNNAKRRIIDDHERRHYLKLSLERLGKDRDGAARRDRVSRLSLDYLSDEIDKVIVGRGIQTEDEYLAEPRQGRQVRLTADQRSTIWRLHEIRTELLRKKKLRTWEQSRAVALYFIERGKGPDRYDAVIVDEAQDLDPNALRILVRLCKSTDRVFITADPNQSIYGSGFQWSAVHSDLKFRGRTSVLRRNYRSTREIGVGATSYLKGGELDDEESTALEYVHSGLRPVLRMIESSGDFIGATMDYVEQARRRNRIGYGGVAMLVPLNDLGRDLEKQLTAHGYPAEFVRGEHIDLQSPRIKIMTLHSAKGLEFPVVVLAGLEKRIKHIRELGSAAPEERSEREQLNRRLLFVAMTRAMRELLVVLPDGIDDPLLNDLGKSGWDVETWPASVPVA